MLQTILDTLTNIGAFFTSIVDFVVDTIVDIGQMVVMLANTAVMLPRYIVYLPLPLFQMIGGIIATAIIFRVLGRD